MEILKYIINKNKKASYSAMINGYYLEEYCSPLNTINTEFIQFTIDGAEEIHNKTRKLKNRTDIEKAERVGIDSNDILVSIE